MTIVYPVIFTMTGDEKDTYLIEIPDINGMTEGYGIGDAIRMARDYIGCTLYDKSDEEFPKASSLEEISRKNGTFASEGKSMVSLVDIDITAYRNAMSPKIAGTM